MSSRITTRSWGMRPDTKRVRSLPDAGEIQESDSMGKVTMNYVSDTGKVLKDPVVRYGKLDESILLHRR